MKNRKRRDEFVAAQVRIELVQQSSGAQRLVHNGLRRERAHVAVAGLPLEGFPRQIQTMLSLGFCPLPCLGCNERLPDNRQGCECDLPQDISPDGNIPPAEPLQALAGDALLESLTVMGSGCFVRKQKQHANCQSLLSRQRDRSLLEEKRARNCSQYADAVAAFVIRGYRAAVRQASQSCQCQPQDIVIRRAVQRRNESDAARLMVKAGAKKGLAGGAN